MAQKTNAIRQLERTGITHEVRSYDLDIEEFSAAAVAELIDMDPAQVFKTLVATGANCGPCFAVVAGDAELDTKALARVCGERRMDLLAVKDLERLTGYRRGGVTAIGARKQLPVYLDASAMEFERIGVSAGTKGLQVLLAPADYVRLTDATVTAVQRPL